MYVKVLLRKILLFNHFQKCLSDFFFHLDFVFSCGTGRYTRGHLPNRQGDNCRTVWSNNLGTNQGKTVTHGISVDATPTLTFLTQYIIYIKLKKKKKKYLLCAVPHLYLRVLVTNPLLLLNNRLSSQTKTRLVVLCFYFFFFLNMNLSEPAASVSFFFCRC